MPTFRITLLVLCILAALSFIGHLDQQAQKDNDEFYCEMVSAHKQDPSTGWPDYRGTYKKFCLNR